MAKKTAVFCSLVLAAAMLASCSNMLEPEASGGQAGAVAGGSMGVVEISLGLNAPAETGVPDAALNAAAQAGARTFLPKSVTGKYELVFTSASLATPGKIESRSGSVAGAATAQTMTIPVTLETGTWNLKAAWYESVDDVYCLVASTPPIQIPPVTSGANAAIGLTLTPTKTAGSGFFSYDIRSDVVVDVTLTLRRVDNGREYAVSQRVDPNNPAPNYKTMEGVLRDVQAGDYYVYVSAITPDGSRGSGVASTAVIYQGLKTALDSPTAPDPVPDPVPDPADPHVNFSADYFNDIVYLAGSLTVPGGVAQNGDAVTITAYRQGTKVLASQSPASSVSYTMGSPEWLLPIAPGVPNVDLDVAITSDATTYTKEKAGSVTGIEAKGRAGIELSVGLYNIKDNTGGGIGAEIGGVARTAAIPGEKLDLVMDPAPAYGWRPGSLTALKESGGENLIAKSGDAYSFTMPAEQVNLNASFYTADLASLSVTTPDGQPLEGLLQTAPNKYEITVENDKSAIRINAAPAEADASVSIIEADSGSMNNLSTAAAGNEFTVRVSVPAEGGAWILKYKDYAVTVKRGLSADVALKSLTVKRATGAQEELPVTKINDTSYKVIVENDVTGIVVDAIPNDPAADVPPVYPNPLPEGVNDIVITVIAENDIATREYTLTAIRKRKNTLKSLSLSAGVLAPLFNANTLLYTATVPYGVSNITVNPQPTDTDPSVSATTRGLPSPLSVGPNTFYVDVEPDYGDWLDDVKTYTVIVTREPGLTGLSIEIDEEPIVGVPLSPAFSSGTFSYTAEVAYSVSSVAVSAAADTGVLVQPTSPVNLAVGANTINVTAKASTQESLQKTYTVTITRAAPSDNAGLSSIDILDGGPSGNPIVTLSTGLNPGPDEVIPVTVPAGTTQVYILPTPSEPDKAEVRGAGMHPLNPPGQTTDIAITVVPESGWGGRETYTLRISHAAP